MDLKEKILKFYDNNLDKIQEGINEKYEKEGLTDRVLKLQLFVNKRRNKYNLPDKSEMIYEEFVQ